MSLGKKKAYFAVMLISTSALLLDGLVLSNDLAESNIPTGNQSETPDTPGGVAQLAIPELPFPRGIEPIDPKAEILDSFAPPNLQAEGGPDGVDADKPADDAHRLSAPGDLSSAAFEAAHRLDGILLDQRLRIASVDGQWTRMGTSIDGCTLISISPRQATFRCFDNEVTLSLDLIVTDPRR